MTCHDPDALHDRSLEQLLHSLRHSSPRPGPALTDRIVQAVVQDRRRRLLHQRWRPLASLAAAACLLVTLGLAVGHRPAPTPREPRTADSIVHKSAGVEPTVGESVQQAEQAVASLTSRAGGAVAQTRSLWQRLPPPALQEDSVRQSLQPPAHSLREAGENVSASLQPVRQSAQRAVELFLRGLPVDAPRQAPL
jgi:hypothetical protein